LLKNKRGKKVVKKKREGRRLLKNKRGKKVVKKQESEEGC
jgi:hypothetical protein